MIAKLLILSTLLVGSAWGQTKCHQGILWGMDFGSQAACMKYEKNPVSFWDFSHATSKAGDTIPGVALQLSVGGDNKPADFIILACPDGYRMEHWVGDGQPFTEGHYEKLEHPDRCKKDDPKPAAVPEPKLRSGPGDGSDETMKDLLLQTKESSPAAAPESNLDYDHPTCAADETQQGIAYTTYPPTYGWYCVKNLFYVKPEVYDCDLDLSLWIEAQHEEWIIDHSSDEGPTLNSLEVIERGHFHRQKTLKPSEECGGSDSNATMCCSLIPPGQVWGAGDNCRVRTEKQHQQWMATSKASEK